MQNGEYWKKRFLQLENASHQFSGETVTFISDQYSQAITEIENQISVWYSRFAKNNNISIAEARQWLSASALKELKWDVQEYIKYGHENGFPVSWSKELENASAKFHISKLEALKMQTEMTVDKLFGVQGNAVSALMKQQYLDGYYHTAFEVQHGMNIGWDIAGINESQLEKVMKKPWATDGLNFSDRIWKNRASLISETHKQLTQNILLGKAPDEAISAISKKFNTSKSQAGRLVMTESAYFSSQAQKDCFNELDVEQYEIVATLDSHTSEICQSMDGQVFPMKQYEAGVTAPPFHPWCRSVTVPYFDDNYTERAARDADDKTYYVPDDIKYPEWKEKFVDGGDLSGFDVIDANGTIHYTKPKPPEPVKPKKEYLTKKKLQANIANADVQLEDLQEQMEDILSPYGVTLSDVENAGGIDAYYKDAIAADKYYKVTDEMNDLEKKYGGFTELSHNGTDEDIIKYDKLGDKQMQLEAELSKQGYSVDSLGNVQGIPKQAAKEAMAEKAQLDALQTQMLDIQQQKADWEEKLNKKLVAEKKKALVKQQAALQQQLDDFEIDTYSNIWKDDVSTTDWKMKKGSIQAKKQYFENKLLNGADVDEMNKWKDLINQLEDFDTKGKAYYDIQDELTKVQKELTNLEKGDIIDTVDDAFTQERKDAALWASSVKDADDKLRDTCGEVWRTASDAEKSAIYDYTTSYSKFNEPLRGIEYGTNAVLGVGNIDFDTIGTTGYGSFKRGQVRKLINQMTDIIEKSTYDFDIWLQRGCDYRGMDSFFGVSVDTLQYTSQAELENLLLGKTVTDYGFFSCGVSKGKGFSHKPIIMNVYAPKGTKMMYAEPFSAFGNGSGRSWDGVSTQSSFGSEAEIILQQGTSFRITKVEKTGSKLYVDIEVVLQNTPQR